MRLPYLAASSLLLLLHAGLAMAADPSPVNDNLNAVLWDQTSVEAQANAIAIFALAQARLDEALVDKSWTAAPVQQTGGFADLPPAVILDVDDTLLNTSRYQAWNVKAGTSFTAASWTQYVKAKLDTPIAGAVKFTQYAASKGVVVFYVTNRTVEEKQSTVELMRSLGFPFRDGGDTMLALKERPEWTSAKGTRREFVAKTNRILLMLGDNFGDFTDAYKGSVAERQAAFDAARAHWGHDWLMLANPTYGSFESAPSRSDYKLSVDDQRRLKRDALIAWPGPEGLSK